MDITDDTISPCVIPMYQNVELVDLNTSVSGLMYKFLYKYSSQFAVYTGVMGTYRIVIEVSKMCRKDYTYLDTNGNHYFIYYVPATEILCDKIVTKNSTVFTTNMKLVLDYVNHPMQSMPKYIMDANSVQLNNYCKTLLSTNLVNNKVIQFDSNEDINSLASLMFNDDKEYLTDGTVRFHKINDRSIILTLLSKFDKLIQTSIV